MPVSVSVSVYETSLCMYVSRCHREKKGDKAIRPQGGGGGDIDQFDSIRSGPIVPQRTRVLVRLLVFLLISLPRFHDS